MPHQSPIPECATSTAIEFVLCSFAVGFDYEEKLFKPTLSETCFFKLT